MSYALRSSAFNPNVDTNESDAMHVNRKLKQIADLQCGYFTAVQAVDAGYARNGHVYHTNCGNWLRVERGLFRLPGYADTLQSEFVLWSIWAGKRHGGRLVAISHDSALHFYGLTDRKPADVHLSVPPRRNRGDVPGCIFHRAELNWSDVSVKDGFHVTTPYRTLLDMKPDLVLRRIWTETVQHAVGAGLMYTQTAARLLSGTEGVENKQMVCVTGWTQAKGDGMDGWTAPCAEMGQRVQGRMTGSPTGSSSHLHNVPTIRKAGFGGLSRQAFTLVELLVVIAIITILSALLLPSLRKSVNFARSASCINNQKQISCGLGMYTNDYGFIPPHITLWGATWYYWQYFLSLELQENVKTATDFRKNHVFKCSAYPVNNNYWLSYAMNHYAGWRRPSTIRNPGRIMFIADRLDGTHETTFSNQVDRIDFRHSGMANVLFLDGHVTTVNYVYPPLHGGPPNAWRELLTW